MTKHVAIDSITLDRALDPGDDLSELVKSIKEEGQIVPVLVTQDYQLIDGLRRLEALRSMGETEIIAVPTVLYPRACEVLKQAVQHGVAALPLTPDRIWHLYSAMQPILATTKAHYQRGKRKTQGVRQSAGGRELFVAALNGAMTDGELQALIYTYRALSDPARAQKASEALSLNSEGKLSYYGMSEYVRKAIGFTGRIKAPKEQMEVLEAAVTSLHGVLRALNQLGPISPKNTTEEMEAKRAELSAARYKLTKFINMLSEEINKR